MASSTAFDILVDGGSASSTLPNISGVVAPTTVVSASNGILVNNLTVGTSYTIPAGYSGTSAGPITVASGVAVTVPSGSRWVVL